MISVSCVVHHNWPWADRFLAMAEKGKAELGRREILTLASLAGGAIGTVAAASPFIISFAPSRKAKGEGSPVQVDISGLEKGTLHILPWRRKPVWVLLRTDEMLKQMEAITDELLDPSSASSKQPEYCNNKSRSISPEIFVALGVCTHLGCSPGTNDPNGFLCACHGSAFDYAGRVFKGSPAPTNLEIPNHHFVDTATLVVGEDAKA